MSRARLLAPLACTLVPLLAPLACSSKDAPAARDCVLEAPDVSAWRLRADGTLLRDAYDRVVALRGVDAGGRSKLAPYAPFDFAAGGYDAALASYMDRAASWGIDVLRVPFTWAAVEPTQGKDDEEFLARYDALLDAAWARGMRTVIDFHQDVYAENFCGDGFPSWTLPDPKPAPHHDCNSWGLEYFGDANVRAAFDRLWADGSPVRAAMMAMWDRMIARYKDRPGVIGFEIINEPGWGTADLTTFEATTLSAFFAEAVPHVRAAAPETLVFVDPTGFSGTTETTPLKRPPGDGVVFAPHYYPLSGNKDSVIDGLQKWADIGAQWSAPVFVGEFGTRAERGDAVEFLSAHWDALDALGIHGTEWEYSVTSQIWNGETFSIVSADGTELPVASAIVRPYARAIAGSDVSSTFDTAARSFTVAYTPAGSAGAVSEVALPARAYPAGYDVKLSGGCVDRTKPERLLVKPDGTARVVLTVTSR